MPDNTQQYNPESLSNSLLDTALGMAKSISDFAKKERSTNPPARISQSGSPSSYDSTSSFNNPLFSKLGTETTPYGGSTKFESFHPALDIAMPTGTPIKAFTSGTVVGEENKSTGFGKSIIAQDPQGNYQRYSHLSESYVPIGYSFKKGEDLGASGKSGSVYSQSGKGDPSHLDYRIWKSLAGVKKYINPNTYLQQYGQ